MDNKSNKIRKFWGERAKNNRLTTQSITHNDIWQRWIEIEMIKRFLKKNQRVLDVGCGNGYTTLTIAPLVKEIIGIDYSKEMIDHAKNDSDPKKHKNVSLFVQDLLDLQKKDFRLFDLVISERCLINLSNWRDQKRAIFNIASVIKKDGYFIFIEGYKDGRVNLNKLRVKMGLSHMPTVWHNIDFNKEKIKRYLDNFFYLKKDYHFGSYDLIARVIHPLFVAPTEPKYDSLLNKLGARLALDYQENSSISRVLFWVLQKK